MLARRRMLEPPTQDCVFDARQVQRAPGHDDPIVVVQTGSDLIEQVGVAVFDQIAIRSPRRT